MRAVETIHSPRAGKRRGAPGPSGPKALGTIRIGRNASIGAVAAGRVSGGRLGATTERGEAHAGGATAVQWGGAGRREGSVVALDLVDKRDLSAAESLTPEAENAIRAVVGGVKCAELEAMVLDVMKRAREARLWLGCDCRSEAGRRPVVAPCRNHRGTDFWRVLAGRQAAHDESCVFHRTRARRRRDAAQWDRAAIKAPEGLFAVLRDRAEEQRVSKPGGRSGEEDGERTRVRLRALRQRLLMLVESAGLNRLRPGEESGDARSWPDALLERAKEIEIAPGRLLCDLWFPAHRMWRRRLVHARVRAAAKDWPAGHKPQGFLCWVVWDVDARGVGTLERNNRVEVVSGVGRPVVGRNLIAPPYLFLGAVGMDDARIGYECLEAYAQPIVASDCPVPVDSHYERRAFGTLRTTLRILSRTFPDTGFELEKPLFEIETPDGPCVPDFLIRARRGGEQMIFVIEVMGFERPEYLRGKEVTHPRMATLGTLCTMQANEFDRSPDGLKSEGRKVTQAIRRVLEGSRNG